MASIESTIISWLIKFVIFAISALPLYFAVSVIRKKVSFLKVLIVTFLAGIMITAIQSLFSTWGALIAFIMLLWVYREVFRLRWINAFLVWLLQIIFIILFNVLIWLIASVMGVSLPYLF